MNEENNEWMPKTRTGRLVKSGEITSLDEIFHKNIPILEPEIVDYLVPNLEAVQLAAKRTTRVRDSGRQMSLQILAAVGNKDGYVGIGIGKGQSRNAAFGKAIRQAKLNIKKVARGCGSWECACSEEHSLPIKVSGKSGSVEITIMPGPKGLGIVAGKIAKQIIELAGIKDCWTQTKGNTKNSINFARATITALNNTVRQKSNIEV